MLLQEDEDVTHLHGDSLNSLNSLQGLNRIQSSVDRNFQRAENSDAKSSKSKHFCAFLYDLLWPNVILDHLDLSSLKIVLRSWLMMWSLTLLCICGGTTEFMGPSSFLANFTAGIEIAGDLSVSSAFVYCMGDLLSMLFACLTSVITLAIGWRIRGYPSEESVIENLLSHGRCIEVFTPSFANCIEPEMQKGYFLDIKVTVVTIFGMLFSFTICGYFQSTSKYGKLAWLLNSLYTIIVFPFNNLMPLWKPWFYARNCVVPMAMAFAARFIVSLVVLPFSSHFKVVSSLAKACSKLRDVCMQVQDLSKKTKPSDADFSDKFTFISTNTQSIFTKLIINEVDMEMVNNLEVWFSHFEKADLAELRSQTRLIMSALSSFHFFYESMADRFSYLTLNTLSENETSPFIRKYRSTADKMREHRLTPRSIVKLLKESWKETGAYELRQKVRYQNMLRPNDSNTDSTTSEERKSVTYATCNTQNTEHTEQLNQEDYKTTMIKDLDDEYRSIIEGYDPVVTSTYELLGLVSEWLCQTSHIYPWALWFTRAECRRKHQRCFNNIKQAMEKHSNEIKTARQRITPTDQQFALYGFVCLHFARRVKRLARWCILIHNEHPTPKLTWPFKQGTGSIPLTVNLDDMEYDGYHDNIGEDLERTYTSFKPHSQVQVRNPDSTPPRTMLHIIGLAIQKIHRSCYNPDILFSLKRAILTSATLTPYFCRPTCQLAYEHWFLWVAVLTAYTVARQAVDGIYGLIAKFFFTFFGCLVGMIGWYISAGSGMGNPYGYAAVTAFIWLYICFQRQFNSHFIPATSIVFSCTVTLVLGNSWNSGHVSLAGVALGRGFSVAWIRFVTVTIGITVSFLGTILPHAYTAKKAVRVIIGTCLEHLGDLQASISNFGIQRFNINSTHIVAHTDVITSAARAIITNLSSAETLRKRLVYEPPLAGIYPTNSYKLLINYAYEITLLYSLIYAFLDELDEPSKIPEILRIMGWTDPQLSAGVYSLVYMSCRALTDGKALPSVTSANLVEQHIFGILRKYKLKPDGSRRGENDQTDPVFTTAVALSTQIYERLDGVVILIKELVGEVYDLNMDLFDFDLEKNTSVSHFN